MLASLKMREMSISLHWKRKLRKSRAVGFPWAAVKYTEEQTVCLNQIDVKPNLVIYHTWTINCTRGLHVFEKNSMTIWYSAQNKE